jgi:ATP-dependent Zn protease
MVSGFSETHLDVPASRTRMDFLNRAHEEPIIVLIKRVHAFDQLVGVVVHLGSAPGAVHGGPHRNGIVSRP